MAEPKALEDLLRVSLEKAKAKIRSRAQSAYDDFLVSHNGAMQSTELLWDVFFGGYCAGAAAERATMD